MNVYMLPCSLWNAESGGLLRNLGLVGSWVFGFAEGHHVCSSRRFSMGHGFTSKLKRSFAYVRKKKGPAGLE